MPYSLTRQTWTGPNANWKRNGIGTWAAGHMSFDLDAELDAWISAVNALSQNASAQITKLRTPNDNTEATAPGGWVIQLQNPTSDDIIVHQRVYTSNRFYVSYTGDTWVDDTSFDGLGSIQSSTYDGGANTGIIAEVVIDDVSTAKAYLAKNDTEGSEFFCLLWTHESSPTATSNPSGFMLQRLQTGGNHNLDQAWVYVPLPTAHTGRAVRMKTTSGPNYYTDTNSSTTGISSSVIASNAYHREETLRSDWGNVAPFFAYPPELAYFTASSNFEDVFYDGTNYWYNINGNTLYARQP